MSDQANNEKAQEVLDKIPDQAKENYEKTVRENNSSNDNPPAPPKNDAPVLDLSGLIDAVNAIPEKVADAVKEMKPEPPAQPAPPKEEAKEEAKEETKTETHSEPGKPKSFADWWFG